MGLVKWEKLPQDMRNECVMEYYKVLYHKRYIIIVKRVIDILFAFILFVLLAPLFIIVACAVKLDSKGSVLFHQTRVTQYGRLFKIYKFRTMIENADKNGELITKDNDTRITKIGGLLRKYRIDEIPQLINIIKGDTSFVGIRPEVEKYVQFYSEEMKATLLLPAGVTSKACVLYRDEGRILAGNENIDHLYINIILHEKMRINLDSLKTFSLTSDFYTIILTIFTVANIKFSKCTSLTNNVLDYSSGEKIV
jgi:lipopolysaccharide/colanic/teichoic acid biosynthesis glycosyltransferase